MFDLDRINVAAIRHDQMYDYELTALVREVVKTAIEWRDSRFQDDHLLIDAVDRLIAATEAHQDSSIP